MTPTNPQYRTTTRTVPVKTPTAGTGTSVRLITRTTTTADSLTSATKEMTMPNSNNRHVVPNARGAWDVKAPGAERASSHHDTQPQAEQRAKEIVRNRGGGEIRIHPPNGRFRDSDTVDPRDRPH